MKHPLLLSALLLTTPALFAQAPPAPAPAAPAPSPAAAEAEDHHDEPHVEPLGFTWWNDIPEMIRRGNEALKQGDTATSTEYYRNAQLKNPEEPVAAFNYGLARAKEADVPGAVEQFRNAINLAPDNRDLRNRAYYNMGVSQFELAKAAEKAQKRDQAINGALDAIESLDAAIREGGPSASEAEELKKQAQHFLQQFAIPPPPQQQQQKQDKNNDKQDQNDQQQKQQDGQQQQQQSQDQQQKQDPKPEDKQDQQQPQYQEQQQQQQQQQQDSQQNQDEKKQDQAGDQKQEEEKKEEEKKEGEEEKKDEQEQQGGEKEQEAKADQLTEEQARQLLNLVDDDKSVRLRKGGKTKQDNAKDW